MKLLSLATIAALTAFPAYASTYHFSYSVGSSTGGSFYDYDSAQSQTADIEVSGFVETDGTLGEITEANIVSWGFTLSGAEDSLTIGSNAAFGYWSGIFGTFNATAGSLTAIGNYQFASSEYEFDRETGEQETYHIGHIHGGFGSSNFDRANIFGYDRDCSAEGCSDPVYFGEAARTDHDGESQFTGSGQSAFVGLRQAVEPSPTPVPLPAGLPLLLAGLGGLALLRRRQKA